MNVLFIAPRLPLPADTGGKIRTFNIVKQVAKHHQVCLVCFSFEEHDHQYVKELEGLGMKIVLVQARKLRLIIKAWIALMNPLPFSAAKYYSKDMDKVIARLKQENEYELVHIDHIHMAHYVAHFKGVPLIVDEHNVEYRILERCADVEKFFLKKILFNMQARKMKKFESKKIKRFSACCAVSGDDANILEDLGEGQVSVHVLPNGVDTEFFQSSVNRVQDLEEDAVVFTGSMDWFPNNDSALFFCKKILPLIWKVKKDVKFYIVGKDPSDELKEAVKNEERIVLTGRVDDVRVFMDKSKVFVVPLRIGGGTRLKILEAMSMQKCVVSTLIGAEGIAYTNDRNIAIVDTPEEFAKEVLFLLNDKVRRKRLEDAGRRLVLEKYDWNIVGKKLMEVYEKIKK